MLHVALLSPRRFARACAPNAPAPIPTVVRLDGGQEQEGVSGIALSHLAPAFQARMEEARTGMVDKVVGRAREEGSKSASIRLAFLVLSRRDSVQVDHVHKLMRILQRTFVAGP
jgi:hypothetical protein